MKVVLVTYLWVLLVFVFYSVNGDEKVVRNNVPRENVTILESSKGGGVKEIRNKTTINVLVNNKGRDSGGGGYGWGFGWGWGAGGGGGGGGKRGGGGGWWRWGCKRHTNKKSRRHYVHHGEHRNFNPIGENYYMVGEFAQCMGEGRCKGMRLNCPLHCGGPCYYDSISMCKPHCRHGHQ